MNIGTIKWFIPDKGYGFIKPKYGGGDIFLHVSELKKIPVDVLNVKALSKEQLEGICLQYEITTDTKGRKLAVNIKIIDK